MFADDQDKPLLSFTSTEMFLVKRIAGVAGDLVVGNQGKLIVPRDCYFVLGDNRLDSLDSRAWGVVPRNLLVGRARLVLWSAAGGVEPQANATTTAPARSAHVIRTERLFKPIR